MKKVIFIETDRIHQDQTTNYWFSVDGTEYAISDNNGSLTLLDCNGLPIEDCNDYDNIKDILIPVYKRLNTAQY